MEPNRTHYVRSGDGYIACEFRGEGPFDLVVTGNWTNDAQDLWHHYRVGGTWLGWRRSVGCWSSTNAAPACPIRWRSRTWPRSKRWTDQLGTVLDAAEMPQPTLIGWAGGGLVATLFAASRPERTQAVVLPRTVRKHEPCIAGRYQYPAGR